MKTSLYSCSFGYNFDNNILQMEQISCSLTILEFTTLPHILNGRVFDILIRNIRIRSRFKCPSCVFSWVPICRLWPENYRKELTLPLSIMTSAEKIPFYPNTHIGLSSFNSAFQLMEETQRHAAAFYMSLG